MKVIEPSTEILTPLTGLYKILEIAGRTCYKSEDKIAEGTAAKFVGKLMSFETPHDSVIEHSSVSVKFIIDRGVSHELVRHRLCAFSQESTRYCNYGKYKFGREITVIRPLFWLEDSVEYQYWRKACEYAEESYFDLLEHGATPQQARSVLPNALKTEIVVTANLREWRHIFKMRCSPKAHPQMRQVMVPLLETFHSYMPEIYASSQNYPPVTP